MADTSYSKRTGDRREGRQLRSLPASVRIAPYLLRRRSGALCSLSDSIEVSAMEQWLRDKRGEGWAGLGFLHLLIAAYVRTVSMRPGINRFISARRYYARNDILVVIPARRGNAGEIPVKVSFSPTDTVFDVYRRVNEALDEVRAEVGPGAAEKLANSFCRLPRFALRFAMMLVRALDYFDWLPRKWLDASPYHASLSVLDLGSLGAAPADPCLGEFGNLPCAVSFGAKRKTREPDGTSAGVERHYVDLRFSCDSRLTDSAYFAGAVKCLRYFMKNPQLLELPPESVEDDVN